MVRSLLITIVCLSAVSLFAQAPESAFLRTRVSTVTKSGVIGFPPGTKAEVVRRQRDKITIKIQNQVFDVKPDQITTDNDAAAQLAAQDEARQRLLQEQLTAPLATTASPSPSVTPHLVSPQVVQSNLANDRLAQINKRREELKIQLEQIKFDQKGLPKPNSSKVSRRRVYNIQSSPKAEALAIQEKEIEKRMFDLDQEERRLKLQLEVK